VPAIGDKSTVAAPPPPPPLALHFWRHPTSSSLRKHQKVKRPPVGAHNGEEAPSPHPSLATFLSDDSQLTPSPARHRPSCSCRLPPKRLGLLFGPSHSATLWHRGEFFHALPISFTTPRCPSSLGPNCFLIHRMGLPWNPSRIYIKLVVDMTGGPSVDPLPCPTRY
jgi:hypothetical protein